MVKRRSDTLGAIDRRKQEKVYADFKARLLKRPTGRLITDGWPRNVGPVEPVKTVESDTKMLRECFIEFDPAAIDMHPQRYPVHPGLKGQVFDGECNRTACTRLNAIWYNRGTRGYYCAICADGINYNRSRPPLCVKVDGQLTREQQEQHWRDHMTDGSVG